MKSLQKLARAQKGKYYALYVIAIALATIIVLQSYLIASIVDQVFLGKETTQFVFPLLLVLLGVLLGRVVLSYANGQVGVKMASKVKKDIRDNLLQNYSKATLIDSYKGQAGQKVSVMLDVVDEIDSFFSKYVPQKILTSIVPIVILIVIFSQHVYSGLIILVTAPFIPIFMIIIGRATQRKSEEQLDSLAAFSGRFLDTLQGLVSLKVFGRSTKYKEVIQDSSLQFRDKTMHILKVAFTSSLMLEFISMLSIGLVALELGLRLVVFQEISFFTAFFILLLVPEFYSSLKELGSAFHAGRSSMGAAAIVEEELEKKEQEVEWGTKKVSDEPIQLQLKQVGFQYKKVENSFALQDITISIPPKGQVAIVGKSGSGKTTLLHLIAGLLPVEHGEITVNEHQRNELDEKHWFSKISYITQHPYLFAGTIAENISLGIKATKEEIELAAAKAGIDELIQELPQGFDTLIGESGRGLSGGEKQRIALARAFLKKPTLVLFDEPTTGLDLLTEQRLHESMKELAQNATVITVAHRLQTIKDARNIIFLEKGFVTAEGTHEELLSSFAPYQLLFSRKE
ncbi:thiol reductant ABC exporter subunit CydD [Bacillus alkalicellulosilyticus]|uniref:thiol reductant ABC exporter subunit CydD n=1 Tax=Alkalihalobacterium alkalicellulosilyticum TaxID=1912214 RepID=UPI0009979CB7|nr:thiol reductant ABC exporter subunit CydD [Bacillus alkalicellulosilyticus]